ncbi:non-specific lipid-transfer protein 3-like [Alnus glutinosa]|uniref:non-specific lipid-transfer protein 3-like n=1 Tax=Alnus glutinosa TaxID=3517 RepID=UPI002D766F89|nr:non-specific lipid-transfer protein 3-like [Alnus glutinosa]
MASSVVFKLTCLALVCTVVIAAKAQRVVPCDEIVSVSDTCCGGILSLRQLTKTKMESRSICTCLKKFLRGFPYTNDHVRLGAALPEKCGVNLPYVISPTMDCNMYD